MASSLGTRLVMGALSVLFTIVVVLGVISAFSTPADSVSLSKGGFHLLGNGAGATKAGIGEFGNGFKETGGAGPYVPDPTAKASSKAKAKN